jgi:hypothetical protein
MTSKTTQFFQGFQESTSHPIQQNIYNHHFTHLKSPPAKDLLLAPDFKKSYKYELQSNEKRQRIDVSE